MHRRGTPQDMNDHTDYSTSKYPNLPPDSPLIINVVAEELQQKILLALAEVPRSKQIPVPPPTLCSDSESGAQSLSRQTGTPQISVFARASHLTCGPFFNCRGSFFAIGCFFFSSSSSSSFVVPFLLLLFHREYYHGKS